MSAANDPSATAEDNSFSVNVNGREFSLAETGQIVSGPAAVRGKFVAPTQFEQLRRTKDYHGHLILSDTQEEVHLAEAELELILSKSSFRPEDVREGALFEYSGRGGRVEEMHDSGVATVNVGGGVFQVEVSNLLRDAEFRIEDTRESFAAFEITEADEEALNEGATEVSSGNNDPVEETLEILESKTDDVLLAEAHLRLEIVRKRKDG